MRFERQETECTPDRLISLLEELLQSVKTDWWIQR
jgi:hypothetical protein